VVKLRLKRMGAKKRPSYRIVATESSSPRDGRFIEQVGFYDPLTDPSTVKLNEERVRYWLSVGAQPSETVMRLLKREGIVGGAPSAEAATTAAPASTPAA
jgi:small subunit ribosomal protein S16